MPNNTNGVVGTDNHAPVRDENSPTRIWARHDIYFGEEGYRKYVPKVKDRIQDWDTGMMWEVVGIDETTMIPILRELREDTIRPPSEDDTIIIGAGFDSHGETFRLFVNKAVIPNKCMVDQRCFTGALHARYAKIYRVNVGSTDPMIPISMRYNSNGEFVDNEIPLAQVAATLYDNIAIKTVEPFRTTYDLVNGEKLVLVYHGAQGEVTSSRVLVVQDTAFFPSEASDTKHIVDISLESSYMLDSEPGVLEYPINLTVNSLNAIGVVEYSDGSKKRLPAQGGQFRILGLNDYVASVPNHDFPISLVYTLGPDEKSFITAPGNDNIIIKPYTLRTGQRKNAYSVRLHCYPVWVDPVNGYRLEWFLINLERRTIYRVDSHVVFNVETNAPFNPTLYGVNQQISVSVDLSKVAGYYNPHIHVQVFNITLVRQGTERGTNWTIADHGKTNRYGLNIEATCRFVNSNLKYLKIDSGFDDYLEWLDNLYWNTNPIYDRFAETKAPEPTHFLIEHPEFGTLVDEPVYSWGNEFPISQTLQADTTLYVRFIYRTVDNDQHLSIAGLPLKQLI